MKNRLSLNDRFLSRVVFLTGILLLTLQSSQNLNAQTAPAYSGHEKHAISLPAADSLTSSFRTTAPAGSVMAEYFGRDAIVGILADSGCVGIRIYHGKKTNGSQVLVMVGVDSSGRDLTTEALAEWGYPCPPFCDLKSSLNH